MKTAEYTNHFYTLLQRLFTANSRDVTDLSIKQNKTTCNITLDGDILMQFKKPYEFWLKSSRLQLLDKYQLAYTRTQKKYDTMPFKIEIADFEFINQNAEFLLELFDEVYLKSSSDAFSFCSKWQQCADELRCVETDKTQAALCRSRKNIVRGLVFNGKNSVLDDNGKIIQEKVQRNLERIPTSKVIKIYINSEAEQISLI